MATTTFTTTAAEDQRLQAWAAASGFANPKAMIISLVTVGLQKYEQAQTGGTFGPPAYTPINPT